MCVKGKYLLNIYTCLRDTYMNEAYSAYIADITPLLNFQNVTLIAWFRLSIKVVGLFVPYIIVDIFDTIKSRTMV